MGKCGNNLFRRKENPMVSLSHVSASFFLFRPLQVLLAFCFVGACASQTVFAEQLANWHWRNPAPFGNTMRSIASGNGRYVAVGDDGVVHTSIDGLSWDD